MKLSRKFKKYGDTLRAIYHRANSPLSPRFTKLFVFLLVAVAVWAVHHFFSIKFIVINDSSTLIRDVEVSVSGTIPCILDDIQPGEQVSCSRFVFLESCYWIKFSRINKKSVACFNGGSGYLTGGGVMSKKIIKIGDTNKCIAETDPTEVDR